jgi:hypothetical protein
LAEEINDPIEYRITGKSAAQVDTTSALFNFTYLALELAPDTYLVMSLAGTPDQIAAVIPIVLEVFNTARYKGDSTPIKGLVLETILPESYSSSALLVNFNYPANWTVEETETYVLVTAPSGYSIGLSQYEFYEDEVPAGVENLSEYEVVTTLEQILEQVPESSATEVITFELQGRSAAQAALQDSSGGYLGLLTVQFNDATVGRITIVGTPVQVAQMNQIVMGIAASLQPN